MSIFHNTYVKKIIFYLNLYVLMITNDFVIKIKAVKSYCYYVRQIAYLLCILWNTYPTKYFIM